MFSLSQKTFFATMIVASATFGASFASTATAASSFESCKSAASLFANDTLRHSGAGLSTGTDSESACYRLEIEEAGLLLLETSALEALRLDLQAHRGLDVLGRTASEFLVDVRPGIYTLAVQAQDPSQPLPAHRISSRLLAVAKSETNGELELEPEKSETNGELELEPEKSETNGELELEPEKSETNGELELEPEKSETNGELELEPEKSDACASIRPLIERLCDRGFDADDHGDSLSCASPIAAGRDIRGEIDNGWGDDADVFRFELSAWQTIEILADGDITPTLTLQDDRGQSLGASDTRLVRTLGPGVYFLRLDAQYETGAYQLAITGLRR